MWMFDTILNMFDEFNFGGAKPVLIPCELFGNSNMCVINERVSINDSIHVTPYNHEVESVRVCTQLWHESFLGIDL